MFELCPLSELHKARDDLPEITQRKLRRFFRSAQFTSLRFRIDQMRFFREQSQKFTF
jgi:hypothetical protein